MIIKGKSRCGEEKDTEINYYKSAEFVLVIVFSSDGLRRLLKSNRVKNFWIHNSGLYCFNK